MTLSKYKDFNSFTDLVIIKEEIFILQKKLFNLRMDKYTNKKSKLDFFSNIKRKIAQLKFKKNLLNK